MRRLLGSDTRMNSPAQRPALLAGAALLTVLVTTFGGSARLTASTSPIPPGAIVPGDRERMIARQVGGILQDSH